MGDRVLVVFKCKEEFSPTVYVHWGGSSVWSLLEKAAPIMRRGDLHYATARFIGTCHESSPRRALGLGVFGPPVDEGELYSAGFSRGDAGVILVDVDTGEALAFNGYGFIEERKQDDDDRPTPKNPHRRKLEGWYRE